MDAKLDARVSKTNDKLKKALLDLMKVESIDNITVTRLCHVAGINRNTFYAHYKEPVDLLAEIENELMAQMGETFSKVDNASLSLNDFIRSILETMCNNKEICSIILSDKANRHFVSKMVNMISERTIVLWTSRGLSLQEATVTYHYCVGGALGVIENWVRRGYDLDVENLAAMLSDLVEKGNTGEVSRY